MKKLALRLAIVCALGIAGCVGFKPIKLETSSHSEYKPSGYEGLVLTDETLFDFRAPINKWWSDQKYTLKKSGNSMKVTCNGVGPDYAPFGINLDEPHNFTKAPVVRVRVKLSENTDEEPMLRMDLKDVNDHQTNASPSINRIKKSEGYVDYYFDLNHKFKQTYPSAAKVDQKQIAGIQFFVNPGGEPYTGTFFIDEIYTMANKDGSGVVSKDVVIDEFKGDVNLWWACDKKKVDVEKAEDEESALKVTMEGAEWDCFGTIFGNTDVRETPVIRLRVKATSPDPVKSTNILARFIDEKENATDLIDSKLMRELEVGGDDYKEIYFSFKDELYSSSGDFNPEKVNRLIIFINMNKETKFNGNIYVDEAAFVPKMPPKVEKEYNDPMEKPSMCSDCPKADVPDVIAFNNPDTWKSSYDNLKVTSDSDKIVLKAENVGKEWEYVEKELDAPINLYEKQYLQLKAKANGNVPAKVRIDLVDNFGVVSNGRPQEVTVSENGEWGEYYFDLSNAYYQRYPEFKVINAQNIVKLRFYVNGNWKPFSGSIYLDQLTPMEYNETPMADDKQEE